MAKKTTYVTPTSPKSKTVALLLCVFFGLIGAHYYYVGRIGRGILATLTANFLCFGWIIDIFTILSNKFYDNTGMLLRA